MAESEPSAAPAPGPDAPRGVAGFLRHYLIAVQFFTRLPVTGRLADWVGFSPAMLRASAAHFPGVGLLVGGLLGAALALLLAGLPPVPASAWVAAVAVSVAGALLTGAFHEDGLADLADGLGGSLDRERALEIMKDSRIGSYGALALALALLARVSLLALVIGLSPALAPWALAAAHVASRTAPLLLIRALPHVGDTATSKSKPLADTLSHRALAAGLGWAALAGAALAVWAPSAPWWAGALGALLAAGWMHRLLRRRLGGFTGDGLGATQQVAEVLFLLGLVLAW
jgi:adenosylcobinamide-GDP ribazoletransferase